jgi:hydroxymethylbilane synthase
MEASDWSSDVCSSDLVREAAARLHDHNSFLCVSAERAFLKEFGGGCHIPLGALALITPDGISLDGLIASPDGSVIYRSTVTGTDPAEIGAKLAEVIRNKGAGI